MTDPLTDLVRSLNETLRKTDPQFQIGVEVEVGTTISFGSYEHDTFLRVLVTGDGWELVNPKEQARRIEQELYRSLMRAIKEKEGR